MRIRTVAELGALIRDRRRSAGLTQADLAAAAGVSRRWLAAIEAGKRTAAVDLVLRTLGALGLEVSIDARSPTSPQVDLDAVLREYDAAGP